MSSDQECKITMAGMLRVNSIQELSIWREIESVIWYVKDVRNPKTEQQKDKCLGGLSG